MPEAPLSQKDLDALKALDTPTISNVIERLNIRPYNEGFMRPDVRAIFPDQEMRVGYAVTLVMSANRQSKAPVPRRDYWEAIVQVPGPRFIVAHDRDYPNPIGSYWGEVQANIATALGCLGAITDGGVRDLPECQELGFGLWANTVLVSHAYVHTEALNVPVDVGGLTVHPGDLLAADRHGVIQIPIEIATKLPELAKREAASEAEIIRHCQSGEKVTPETLAKAWERREAIIKGGAAY